MYPIKKLSTVVEGVERFLSTTYCRIVTQKSKHSRACFSVFCFYVLLQNVKNTTYILPQEKVPAEPADTFSHTQIILTCVGSHRPQ